MAIMVDKNITHEEIVARYLTHRRDNQWAAKLVSVSLCMILIVGALYFH